MTKSQGSPKIFSSTSTHGRTDPDGRMIALNLRSQNNDSYIRSSTTYFTFILALGALHSTSTVLMLLKLQRCWRKDNWVLVGSDGWMQFQQPLGCQKKYSFEVSLGYVVSSTTAWTIEWACPQDWASQKIRVIPWYSIASSLMIKKWEVKPRIRKYGRTLASRMHTLFSTETKVYVCFWIV